MAKEKIEYSEENLYAENLQQLDRRFEYYRTSADPKVWEASWYYDFIPYQDDEEVRLCAVLPLMKKEIECNAVSDDMKDEIEGYYYAVIIENGFDDILKDDEEREMVKRDLQWCYETAKQNGII